MNNRLPAAILMAAFLDSAASAATLQFSGFAWTVRTSDHGGPGPNDWDGRNVWVDAEGFLHLKLQARDGKWSCAEVSTVNRFGFGRYQFQVKGPLDRLDPNVVLGLFSYPTRDVGADRTHEIDIEFARWGRPASPNGSYTVWPNETGRKPASQSFRFELKDPTGWSIHRFTWSPDTLSFQSFNGIGDHDRSPFATWQFHPTDPARTLSQQPMPVLIDLWSFNGLPPTDGRPVEIIVRSFQFTPP